MISLLILLMLAAARFINLTICWNAVKLELQGNQSISLANYRFLGLSEYETARGRLTGLVNSQIREVTVVSYYDFFHPAVFLIHSRSKNPLVNVGIMNVLPGKGFVDYFFHPTEILEVRTDKVANRAVYYGSAIFPAIYWNIARRLSNEGVGEKAGASAQPLSFIVNRVEDADYLKIPYYVYFYLPLLLILILTAFYGKAFCISFFYYLGLFLLLDFKKALFTIPFSWLSSLLGVNISPTVAAVISVGLAVLFFFGGLSGIVYVINKRKENLGNIQLTIWGKGLIVFFILLPLFLRF
ncbi:MAG: hypothetical protein NT166_00570 [Candidatus Aminicenantes bacterium]|nr:hypothetical protein [Candidatus Aminicenantes bacterium]